jgi:MFS family permease
MKASTLKLCLPVIAMTAQQSAASLVIPPFLHDLRYPVSAIGSLISVAPVLALAARLPSGMAYSGERARILMVAALSVMTVCTFLYSFAVTPFHFALVHAFNGFAYGAATTIYLAFYVEALPPDEDRYHAMGYYAGCLAIGYSVGGFVAGYVADKLGYTATFDFGAFLGLLCLAMLFLIRQSRYIKTLKDSHRAETTPTLLQSLKGILDPRIVSIVVVALFLNMLHQLGNVFLPLYGLAVGLTLTEVGVIKGVYSLCNAITRPLSGFVAKRVGHQGFSRAGLPLQSVFMTLVPFFHDLPSLLVVFVLVGFLRAVAIVANTISVVEDVDQTRVSRGIASGIFNAAADLGNILGPSVGGLIASFTGVANLFLVGPFMIAVLFFIALWGCKFVPPSKSDYPRAPQSLA